MALTAGKRKFLGNELEWTLDGKIPGMTQSITFNFSHTSIETTSLEERRDGFPVFQNIDNVTGMTIEYMMPADGETDEVYTALATAAATPVGSEKVVENIVFTKPASLLLILGGGTTFAAMEVSSTSLSINDSQVTPVTFELTRTSAPTPPTT